jgi:lipoprotein-releasing system ATP-binding protein
MSELIRAEGVCKEYGSAERRLTVLDDLFLSVAAGEKVVIVGQSGVGKSTLLHVLGALDQPSAGDIWFDGTLLGSLDERAVARFRNREIGFVFQFHHLLPDFSALENVMMPAMIAGIDRATAADRARAILSDIGLAERLDHRPGELSGGEQQRVAIARAVVLKPRAVLADEPTGNLDPVTAGEVHLLLEDLNQRFGITLVIVTHNERLEELADRTLRLERGRLVE